MYTMDDEDLFVSDDEFDDDMEDVLDDLDEIDIPGFDEPGFPVPEEEMAGELNMDGFGFGYEGEVPDGIDEPDPMDTDHEESFLKEVFKGLEKGGVSFGGGIGLCGISCFDDLTSAHSHAENA